MESNIYPLGDMQTVTRGERERLLGQRGVVVWLTGLSGSGKSTIAVAVERELTKRGRLCALLDGDNVRAGLNSNLSFSPSDRRENIRRIAEVGKLMAQTGVITLACFVSPTREMREMARDIVGADDFREVFVSTPLRVCEQRDVKGLYARARRGEIRDFTGVDAPFEAPQNPALALDTSELSVEECVKRVMGIIPAYH